MSWRTIQLGSDLCEQDQLIIELFGNQPVRYVGHDPEFAQHLNTSDSADNLILIINQNIWLSEIADLYQQHLDSSIKSFYVGLNRYCVKGNNTTSKFPSTDQPGADLILFLINMAEQHGYDCVESGHFDRDWGRHFNFVQPLTWIYAKQKTNTDHAEQP